ncbi:hypothetical protein [Arthrobacter sp. ZGTC412]|uniref:hypothetical protein n=1 Tax=Arthrobacter sp. ZGTC412 TaxID=2058900 RepID=UPI0015E3FD45|nr:hypothetical protein [Arthrobacter sp. ZGTC412]
MQADASGQSHSVMSVRNPISAKKACTDGFGPLGKQIHLDDGSNVRVKQHPPLTLSLAEHP